MSLADDARLARSPDAMSKVLDGEAVILDLASGTYLGLNEVATRIWELLGGDDEPSANTPRALKERLLEEFEVDAATLERDLGAVLDDMLGRGLIRAT